VAIETREGADRTREESVLRRVPVMLTKDWHGLGRFQGGAAAAPRALGFAAGSASMRQSIMAAPGVSGRGFPVPTTLRVWRPDVAAVAAVADDSPEANVLALLALQRPEGGFDLSAQLAGLAAVPLDVLRDAASELESAGAAGAEALVATAVVLAALRSRFAAHNALWESLVRKSESWLAGELGTSAVLVGGQSLEAWAGSLMHT
jgi:hypothetical protein